MNYDSASFFLSCSQVFEQDICPMKICSGTGSFPKTVNLCGNIKTAFAPGNCKSTKLTAPYFQTLSVSHL